MQTVQTDLVEHGAASVGVVAVEDPPAEMSAHRLVRRRKGCRVSPSQIGVQRVGDQLMQGDAFCHRLGERASGQPVEQALR